MNSFRRFPDIQTGDNILLKELTNQRRFYKPPARLTESSLIKKLEADGIGRPSTYATIIETPKKREYVSLKGKSFVPTELGYEVKYVLNENFKDIMNEKFTADLENKLDEIAEGKENWQKILENFYSGLSKSIEKYKAVVEKDENKIVISDVKCPCGAGYMILKNGRFGRYLACENEECKEKFSLKGIDIPMEDIQNGKIFVNDILKEKIEAKKGKPTDMKTPAGAVMLLKFGRFGSYLESENYTEDNIREPLSSEIRKLLAQGAVEEKDGVVLLNDRITAIKNEENKILAKAGVCEKCGRPFKIGRGRWGRFLACTGYPECRNIKKIDAEGNIIEPKEKTNTKTKKK